MWYTPEELVERGFHRSRIVMMNEAHSGMMRCPRTRVIGQRILPTAHQLGVRYLAMEALHPPSVVEESNRTRQLADNDQTRNGYLQQPEMRAFIQAALDLGWTLVAYEADLSLRPKGDLLSDEVTNWREETQARNLVAGLQHLPPHARLLVWCGNGHLTKEIVHADRQTSEPNWVPMGYWFRHLSGLDPFVIDQTITVRFPGESASHLRWEQEWQAQLEAMGGTAGFLTQEAPPSLAHLAHMSVDAFLLSIHNDME